MKKLISSIAVLALSSYLYRYNAMAAIQRDQAVTDVEVAEAVLKAAEAQEERDGAVASAEGG